MKIIDINDKKSLTNAIEVLASGGVLIFPTDTVYGIGCILDKTAIRKLYKIKNRPSSQPTAVLMTKRIYYQNCYSKLSGILPEEFWTGKMTIIDSIDNYAINFPKMILSADKKIGIRLPQHTWLEKLIDNVGPIVATSANKKGEPAPANFADIGEQIQKEADLVIKSSGKMSGRPSEIYVIETNRKLR